MGRTQKWRQGDQWKLCSDLARHNSRANGDRGKEQRHAETWLDSGLVVPNTTQSLPVPETILRLTHELTHLILTITLEIDTTTNPILKNLKTNLPKLPY